MDVFSCGKLIRGKLVGQSIALAVAASAVAHLKV